MSDLNREGLEAAARTLLGAYGDPLPVAERVVRAYLSSSQPPTDVDDLQEIVCRFVDAIHGTQYVGSEGLTDVVRALGRIRADYPEVLDRAEMAKRTAAGELSKEQS